MFTRRGPSVLFYFCSLSPLAIGIWPTKLSRYRSDPRASAEFDTGADRRIAYWQKCGAIVLCGLVIPILTFVITFWQEW